MKTATTGRLRPQTVTIDEDDHKPAREWGRLAELLGARVHVDVTVPRTAIAGSMRLVTRAEVSQIRDAAREHLKERGYDVNAVMSGGFATVEEWNAELAVRHLAVAVRDPRDVEKPLATLAEWEECDEDQIAALWQTYRDLEAKIDPLANLDALSEEEVTAIVAVAKKSDAGLADRLTLLASYGSFTLARCITALVAPRGTSETPRS